MPNNKSTINPIIATSNLFNLTKGVILQYAARLTKQTLADVIQVHILPRRVTLLYLFSLVMCPIFLFRFINNL